MAGNAAQKINAAKRVRMKSGMTSDSLWIMAPIIGFSAAN